MVYADLVEASGRQLKFVLLGTLLYAMKPNGDYAMFPEKEMLRIAFSREEAARALANTMGASKTAREGGWAGEWSVIYGDEEVEKIRAMLPPPVKRARRASASASSESVEPT